MDSPIEKSSGTVFCFIVIVTHPLPFDREFLIWAFGIVIKSAFEAGVYIDAIFKFFAVVAPGSTLIDVNTLSSLTNRRSRAIDVC